MKYIAQAKVVDAVWWDGSSESLEEIEELIGGDAQGDLTLDMPTCVIQTAYADIVALAGAWVFRNELGYYHVFADVEFRDTYRPYCEEA